MNRTLTATAIFFLLLCALVSTTYAQVNEQWVARTTDTAKEITKAITTDASGNVYVTGRRESSVSNWDILTAKYNSLGTEAWTRTYDGTAGGIDQGHGIGVTDLSSDTTRMSPSPQAKARATRTKLPDGDTKKALQTQ